MTKSRTVKHHSKPPRWLKEQKDKKRRSFFLFLRPFWAIVLFILIGFLGFKIYGEAKASRWDGKHNFNFTVLVKDQIYIISFHPSSQSINILEIPPKTYLPLARGFGEYPVRSIWSLGEQEGIGGGNLLLISSQYFLGVPMQGWGRINSKFKIQNSKFGKKDLMELIINLAISKERNLTLWDLGRLAYKINGLSLSGIDFWSLEQTRAQEEVILPDGSPVFRIQKEFLEKLSSQLFADSDFSQEGIIWGVVNQADYPGMASWVARMINAIGGEVAFFEDRGETMPEGVYCGPQKTCSSYSARLLSKVLNLKLIGEKLPPSRAEAVIILGKDYQRFFYER